MTNPLRTLGFNCFLAAMLPSLMAVVIVAWVHWLAVDAGRDGSRIAYREAVAGICAGYIVDEVTSVDPERLFALLPRWRSITIVDYEYETDNATVLTHWGDRAFERSRITDQVLAGAVQGSAMILPDGHVACANVLRDHHLEPRAVLYVESDEPLAPALSALRDLPMPLGILALGALLSWYLSLRIKRPIDDLELRAQAALHGDSVEHLASSLETASVTSAVDQLAAAYQQHAHSGDSQPPA